MTKTLPSILCFSSSLRDGSSCLQILRTLANHYSQVADFHIYSGLDNLRHFDPNILEESLPPQVITLRSAVAAADAVVICTPEYVFSVPAIVKNALEWCVASTVFSDKPTAMIVASGLGEKTFESLALILKTIQARLLRETMLHLKGVRAKLLDQTELSDKESLAKLEHLVAALLSQTKTEPR